jgi:hypothetical protein
MIDIASLISGSEKLTQIFGRWPSFHDAEIIELTLWRGRVVGDHEPVLTLKVHLWETTAEVDSRGYYLRRNHTLCTLRFRGVDEFSMDGFNYQNVILELSIEEKEGDKRPSPYFAVQIDTSFGMESSFECLQIEVVDAAPCSEDGVLTQ